MNRLLTSVAIMFATTTLAAAAPGVAQPADQQVAEAPAPDAERLAIARRFVALTSPAEELVKGIHAGFSQAAMGEIEDETDRVAAERRLNRMFARFEPKVREHQPAIVEAYAQAYAREFSANELRDMVAFGESPTGRRFLAKMTELGTEESVMDAQMQLLQDLAPSMEDLQKEICAEKAQQRIAMGDTKAKCPLSDPDTAQG